MSHRLFPLVILPLLAGCVVDGGPVSRATRTAVVPHLPGSAVDLEAANGAISLIAGEAGEEVALSAGFRCAGSDGAEADARAEAATLEAVREDDDTLRVRGRCGEPPRSRDGLTLTVRLPEVVGARVATSNGAIETRDTEGPLLATTSNGGIRVERHGGRLEVLTSNASITLLSVEGPVVAETSNGAAMVRLASEATGPVNLVTSNGDVELRVGPGFSGRVRLGTTHGQLSVDDQAGRVVSQTLDDLQGTVQVGTGGSESSLATTNADVRLIVVP